MRHESIAQHLLFDWATHQDFVHSRKGSSLYLIFEWNLRNPSADWTGLETINITVSRFFFFLQISGEQTLNENIADNEGIKLAYDVSNR